MGKKKTVKRLNTTTKSKEKSKKIDSSQKSLLEVRELTKYFGIKAAVKSASFSMKQGEIVGLLGPNGAGKTTIFYMIVGFLNPTFGNIYMDNHRGDLVMVFCHES